MYYTIYQIINLVNGKTYIGAHKTNDLEDDYMGSGKVLKRAIIKHGIENFSKDILAVFDSAEEMFDMESTLVNEEYVNRKDTYNLKEGGCGGDNSNNIEYNEQYKRTISDAMFNWRNQNPEKVQAALEKVTKYTKSAKGRKVQSIALKKYYSNNPGSFTNMNHTPDAKMKIGAANSVHQLGEGNSQFGTHIYCDKYGSNRKRYKAGDQPNGWITTTEYRRSQMKGGTQSNKHWYNDGSKSYLRYEEDAIQENLVRGRI